MIDSADGAGPRYLWIIDSAEDPRCGGVRDSSAGQRR
jgi:hypothetical protein